MSSWILLHVLITVSAGAGEFWYKDDRVGRSCNVSKDGAQREKVESMNPFYNIFLQRPTF